MVIPSTETGSRLASWTTALLCLLLVGALAGCSSGEPAGEPEQTAQAPESPVGGEVLFRRYCASCHGPGGRGDGTVAPLLTTTPPDLTRMAAQNGGRYPLRAMMSAIDGERTIPAHGDSEMPVWGAIFVAELQDSPHTRRTALLHVQAIAEYVRTLQQP